MMSRNPFPMPQPAFGLLARAAYEAAIWEALTSRRAAQGNLVRLNKPFGDRAAAALQNSQRLFAPADTKPAASGHNAGCIQTIAHTAGFGPDLGQAADTSRDFTLKRQHGRTMSERASAAFPMRGRRKYHVDAHADRCAPLGRNSGGGAQGQSD
jgi:hypothetical protein